MNRLTRQTIHLCIVLLPVACVLMGGRANAESRDNRAIMDNPQWFQMPDDKPETRWYTYENRDGAKGKGGLARSGRKGSPYVGINKGQTFTLADIKDSGTIRRIWITPWPQDAEVLRGLKIEMYWDGAKTPAVQAPLGDFFCHSMGHCVAFENACFASPEGRSMNCFIPMPFRKSAKIQIVNESPKGVSVYYDVAVTIGEKHGPEMLYFHSYWRRENYTTVRQDMTILPTVRGRGRFLGCNLGVRLHPSMTNFWWGEGEFKVYLDGDKETPTLCGTGTEDYIGDGYSQNLFINRFTGNHYISAPAGQPINAHGFYRFHIPDPVYFHKDIRVTIQDMGGLPYKLMLEAMDKDPTLKFMKTGAGGEYYTREELEKEPDRGEQVERTDDYCATAYWYQDKPDSGFAPIAPYEERIKDLP